MKTAHTQPDGVVVIFGEVDGKTTYVDPAYRSVYDVGHVPPPSNSWPVPDPRLLPNSALVDVFTYNAQLSASIPRHWKRGIAPLLGLRDAKLLSVITWRDVNGHLIAFRVRLIDKNSKDGRRNRNL